MDIINVAQQKLKHTLSLNIHERLNGDRGFRRKYEHSDCKRRKLAGNRSWHAQVKARKKIEIMSRDPFLNMIHCENL